MPGLANSLSRLRKLRDQFEKRLTDGSGDSNWNQSARPSRLREITNFGSNPGSLRMHVYVPGGGGAKLPMVVALHGCTQTAELYDQGTGWSDLADRLGFIVVFPEQQAANNPKTCFSWYLPADTARDSGEALSIRQMVATAIGSFNADPSRVFVTGLSAGGAMTSVMLATYPEVFAGGAIIAGLPYGAASSVQEAFEAMFNERALSSRALGDHVRGASSHRGPWPKISVWHGTADSVVKPTNGEHIVSQWLDVLKLPERASSEGQIGRHTRRVWRDADGDTRLEAYSIIGMAHGVPLATAGTDCFGMAGPYFHDVGVCSTSEIARFWALDTVAVRWRQTAARSSTALVHAAPSLGLAAARDQAPAVDARLHDAGSARDRHAALEPSAVIAAAFKAAGLSARDPTSRPGSRMIDIGAIIAAALKAAGLKRS